MNSKLDSLPPQQPGQEPGLEAEMTPQLAYIRDNYKGSDKLQGKVALTTGGDSGIGRAVAVQFAREGAAVALTYLPQKQADANETESLVLQEGGRCLLLPDDLRHFSFALLAA